MTPANLSESLKIVQILQLRCRKFKNVQKFNRILHEFSGFLQIFQYILNTLKKSFRKYQTLHTLCRRFRKL